MLIDALKLHGNLSRLQWADVDQLLSRLWLHKNFWLDRRSGEGNQAIESWSRMFGSTRTPNGFVRDPNAPHVAASSGP